jgi:hypothetical protein
MLYLVLLLIAINCWLILRTRQLLSRVNAEVIHATHRLERLEQCQQKMFDLVCDAVDEFGVRTDGVIKNDANPELLSKRLLAGRRALNDLYKSIAESIQP